MKKRDWAFIVGMIMCCAITASLVAVVGYSIFAMIGECPS